MNDEDYRDVFKLEIEVDILDASDYRDSVLEAIKYEWRT